MTMKYRYIQMSVIIPAQGNPPLELSEGARIVGIIGRAPSSTFVEIPDEFAGRIPIGQAKEAYREH
jgi:hypothetical protein